MSHARRTDAGRPAPTGDAGEQDRALTAKVVLMELARAAGPMSATALAERTLLSESAVEEALADLAEADLCSVQPADERRPARFETELSAADA